MFRTTRELSIALPIALIGLTSACGDDGGYKTSGNSADAGPATTRDAAQTTTDAGSLPLPDAAMNSEGPTITLLSPTAPAQGDYSSSAIVTSERFAALCRVEPNTVSGTQVDAASVRISVKSDNASFEANAIPTGVANEFQADIVVADFDNGSLEVRCTAKDTSPEALENSQAIGTFVDLGPTIQILAPIAASSYANQTEIMFSVTEAPVAADDALAAPDFANVELQVSGAVIPGVTNASGVFTGTVVFDDPIFDLVLDGQQSLTVRAPNLRTATNVVRSETLLFNVDSDGPAIEIGAPMAGEMVSGIIFITADVADPTGIQPLSVVATVAGIHEVQMDLTTGSTYSGLFDTRVLGAMIFPNVIIRARDMTGNQSSSGYLIALDNVAPIMSLDSPALRESKIVDGVLECSQQFDPLGSDSVDDGESVAQLFEIRAHIQDLSNLGTSTSAVVVPKASVDAQSVELFILDDESSALLVDTDGDGICDDVNPLLVPSSAPNTNNEVAVISMVPVAPGGSSFFGVDAVPNFAATNNPTCSAADDDEPPSQVCISTPLTRIISTEIGGSPVIYGIPPVADLQCLGNAVDALATNLADGWVCSAVRASDLLGNLNISAPLRFCIDSDFSEDDGCALAGETNLAGAPNCTGTYNSQTNTVDTTTPCTPSPSFNLNQTRRIDL